MKKTTREKILDYIREHGSITTFEAFSAFGTSKLTSRISDLRKEGYPIIGTWEKSETGARYQRYTMDER